ncbi:acyltransferase family protein [uncultured Ilumatobacter sp.]|uniref:acyltransferase family protein n=1 Tax=uncultured Ilumatobacter sp. TaxID=879968 RepID=UPI00374F0DCD
MALNTSTRTSTAAGSLRRLPGPDVIRAIALIGVVVMNYHGYLIFRGGERNGGWASDLFDPWTGPLASRFAATFVLVAGVGVTLLTRQAVRKGQNQITEMRWRLARRGALLYAGGLFLDTIWAGTIIPFYGAMFTLAALMFTLRSKWIALVGAIAVAAGALLKVWQFQQLEAGESTRWLFLPDEGAPESFLLNVFVNGTHPLLPWLGFFCVGILLGRVLDTSWWRLTALGAGTMLFTGASIASGLASTDFQQTLLSTHPGSRGPVYVASALGTALLAFATIDMIANRYADQTDPLRRAGQMTLTLYLAHIFVFNLFVDWVDLVEPGAFTTSLLFSLGFSLAAIAAANMWHRRFGRGPAERIYRAIGG